MSEMKGEYTLGSSFTVSSVPAPPSVIKTAKKGNGNKKAH